MPRNNQEPEIEPPNNLTRNAHMATSEMFPLNYFHNDDSAPFIDLEHKWLDHRNNYTDAELEQMLEFIQQNKLNNQ